MAEYYGYDQFGRPSGESQTAQQQAAAPWNHDNAAAGPIPRQHETAGGGSAPRGVAGHENSAEVAKNFENLSINPRFEAQENIDAADYYRYYNTQRPENHEAAKRDSMASGRNKSISEQPCWICQTPRCVMNGGSMEAERLKETISRLKTARSIAQKVVIGMEYMEPYVEAFDNQWKLDTSNVRTNVKSNLSVPNGKLLAETSCGWSAIIPFCSLGKTELVAVLLHEGVDINATAGARETRPLSHAAAWLGNEDIVRLLIGTGADVNAPNVHGLTALHFAVAVGNINVVKMLVNAGANIDAEADDFNGIHSLPVFNEIRESQTKTYEKIIDYLVQSGASTELRSTTKWTPLQYICITGSVGLAKRLIELGVPKEPLEALRKKAGSEWAFSGYYKDWAKRLEESI